MAIWLRGLEHWYLVLGGVAVGRGFESQSDLELSFAEILIRFPVISGKLRPTSTLAARVSHLPTETITMMINTKMSL
jgi:hypothetical protein